MTFRNRSAGSPADAKLQWAAVRNAIADGRYWIGPGGRRSRWPKLPFNGLVVLFAKGIRLTPLYERGRQNALNLGVFEFEATLPDLPEGLAPRRSAYYTFGMASETETIALRMLCVLYDATNGLPLHWRMSAEMDRETADAIEFAAREAG